MNVLHNAIKFGAGRPIAIELAQTTGSALFRVRDEGVGIEQSDLGTIFSRFGQASLEPANKGLGLGLYIAQRITEAHGGSISVESTPGAGATFTITLPLEPRPTS
jgi:two-component system, LuxR family, sensor kinase FixL